MAISYLTLTPDPWWAFGSRGKATEESLNVCVDDFFQHGIAYALLAVLLLVASLTSCEPAVATCVTIAMCHACFTEMLQYWIPLRSFDVLDLLANLIGVAAGWGIVAAVLRIAGQPAACRKRDDAPRKPMRSAQILQ